jgi:hypothetical protein
VIFKYGCFCFWCNYAVQYVLIDAFTIKNEATNVRGANVHGARVTQLFLPSLAAFSLPLFTV